MPDLSTSSSSPPEMGKLSQQGRMGRLFTPLGEDKLGLLEVSGVEGVNQVGEYRVKAVGDDKMVDFDALLGRPMRIVLEAEEAARRIVNMTVVGARYVGEEADNRILYEFELRPWIWLMDQRVNSRIFNELPPVEIISAILQDHKGIDGAKFDIRLNTPPAKLEYCVQYGESDLAFVRRLLEEFGLNFFMEMDDTVQTLVITDNMEGFAAIPGRATRALQPHKAGETVWAEHFTQWLPQRGLTPGAVKLTDYNFLTPKAEMEVVKNDKKSYESSTLETYAYPGRYGDAEKGAQLAQRRLDALRAGDHTVRAQGELVSLGGGMKFTLTDHAREDENDEYICLASTIHLREAGYHSSGATIGKPSFRGHYDLARSSAPLAPRQMTKKAVVQGPQTARVIADKNVTDEIDCDKHGRILVQFPWAAKSSSMRCRVSQSWAGNGWGAMHVPRVGMEVVVEFLNGDPDAPIVTGCVYNADNKPPFDLPAKKMVSGVKSRTYKGDGYNQFSFDDTNGKQLIHMHAERDLDIHVKNDTTTMIDANRTDTVKKKHEVTVKGNRVQTISDNDKLEVKDTLTITAGTKIALKVGGSTVEITSDAIEIKTGTLKIKANNAASVEAMSIKVDASADLKTNGGATAEHKAGGPMTIQAAIVQIN